MDMLKCLNLLCLLSVTEGGLSTPTYESLVLQFLQVGNTWKNIIIMSILMQNNYLILVNINN